MSDSSYCHVPESISSCSSTASPLGLLPSSTSSVFTEVGGVPAPVETMDESVLMSKVREVATPLLNQFQEEVKNEIANMTLTGVTSHEAKTRAYNPAEERMKKAIVDLLSPYDRSTNRYLRFDKKENGIIITKRRELERAMNEVMAQLQTHFEVLLSRLIAQEREAQERAAKERAAREAQERAAKEAEEKRCASLVLEQLNEYVRLRNQDNLRVSSANERRMSQDFVLDGGMGFPEPHQDVWPLLAGRHDRIAAIRLHNYDTIVNTLTRACQQTKAERRSELVQGLLKYKYELRSHYGYWRAVVRIVTKTDHVDGQPYRRVVEVQERSRWWGNRTQRWVAPHVRRTSRTWTVYHRRNGNSYSTSPESVSIQEVQTGPPFPMG